MKTKIFITLMVAFAIGCSPKEEKKEDTSTELSDQEGKEDAPSEESSPVEESSGEEAAPEEEVSVSSDEESKNTGPESIGTGGPSAGSGSGMKSKKIEAKSDITVGEEGVR